MKELTIEQKAQRYDEALERYKAKQEYESKEVHKFIEYIFPELKESKDERIRKAILELVRQSSDILENKNQIQMIAWLEKQAEQKPDDKVEPKFKVGDWLCENEPNNYARFMQILEIVNVQGKERYGISRDIHNDKDIVEFDFVEKYYHKFDIQDANVGDVLVHNCCTFIFMGVKNGIVQAIEKYLSDGTNPVCFGEPDKYNDYHPATQKQRDALMKAIADDGYAFDFEKKKLKKIEQPHAWSEEDDQYLLVCKNALAKYQVSDKWDATIISRWLEDKLKSIRPQKQWKPSEEQMKALEWQIRNTYTGSWQYKATKDLFEQLKRL